MAAIILGAIAPTRLAVFVVFPLKGEPVAGGRRSEIVIGGFLLNSIWGPGVALAMRLGRPPV